jgi:hypothetical protein
VNLWKSLVWLAPEILTIGGCLQTLLIPRRVAQRPQARGELPDPRTL